jgi:hypothetical protein
MSKAGSDSRRQNRKDRMMKSLSITLVTMLVAGIFVAILSLLWFDGPSPIFAQTDTTAPTVSSVAITSDPDENDADLGAYIVGRSGGSIVQSTNWASGVYRIGDDVQVTVTFSENVTVTGSPQLELVIGSNNRELYTKLPNTLNQRPGPLGRMRSNGTRWEHPSVIKADAGPVGTQADIVAGLPANLPRLERWLTEWEPEPITSDHPAGFRGARRP